MRKFEQNPFSTPSLKECQSEAGEEVVNALVELGDLVAVSQDVLFRKKDYDALVEKVRVAIEANGEITLAEARDTLGTTRKYAQALLEHLDAIGITIRAGDARKLKSEQRMTPLVRRIFTPPVFEDEETTHKAYFLNIIVWVLIFFPPIYFLYVLIKVPADASRALIQGAFAEIINGFILYLVHHRQIRTAIAIQISGLWIFFTASAVTGAGVRGESYLLGYPLVIMIAGILKNRRVAIGITLLSLIAGWLMAYAESHGQFVLTNISGPITAWVISLVLFPLGTVSADLFHRKSYKTPCDVCMRVKKDIS